MSLSFLLRGRLARTLSIVLLAAAILPLGCQSPPAAPASTALRELPVEILQGTAATQPAQTPMPADFTLELQVRLAAGPRPTAAVLFRAARTADGLASGYTATLDGAAQRLTLAAVDGADRRPRVLARRSLPLAAGPWYWVRIAARDRRLQIYVEPQDNRPAEPWPKIDLLDARFTAGSVGLQAGGGSAAARQVRLGPPPPPPAGPTYDNTGGLVKNLADPYVLRVDQTYYLYGTGGKRGVRVFTSPDLVHWQGPAGADGGFALTAQNSWGTKWFWAPEVYHFGGAYSMFYSVEKHLAVATSASPLGPFVQNPRGPMHPGVEEIDGHVFTDTDGAKYLYYVHLTPQGQRLMGARLAEDGRATRPETAVECLRPGAPWEGGGVTEGPFVLKHKGTYYLMYSANGYTDPNYSVGYATSASPLGPFTKYRFNPVLASNAAVAGAGHHCVTSSPDGSELFIVYHTHNTTQEVQPRKLAIDRMRFRPDPAGGPDIIEIWGPTLGPQPMPKGSGR